MKRHITELEKNLIEKGWELDHKTYWGKHSDKVLNYVYEKVYLKEYTRDDGKVVVNSWSARVLLDQKREKIEDVLIKSPFKEYTDDLTCILVHMKLGEIKKEVYECDPNRKVEQKEELSTEEQVEVAEAVGGSNE